MTSSPLLVTGGAGFIGSHLVDSLLAGGHAVRVLDDLSTGDRRNLDPRAELHLGDAADPDAVARAIDGAGGVFHLAAIASVARANEDWPGTHRANQSATVAVLDAARAAGRLPVVYASSAAIYGDTAGEVAHEGLGANPATAYGCDKYGSELHARVGSRIHGVPTLGLRFFNVYGPRQDPSSPYSGVISIFARRLAEGAAITLHGDGRQTRDFVHVADVVAHLRAAMERLAAPAPAAPAPAAPAPAAPAPAAPAPEVVALRSVAPRDAALWGTALNVCTGRGVTVAELAQLLGRGRAGAPRLEHGPPRPGDIRHSLGDPTRAAEQLGVRARIRLEDGLTTLQV